MSADQIVILILLIALVVKFIFFENRDELHDQIRLSHVAAKSSQTVEIKHVKANNLKELQQKEDENVTAIARIPLFTIEEQNCVDIATQTEQQCNIHKQLQEEQQEADEDKQQLMPYRKKHIEIRAPRSLQECIEILNSTEECGGAMQLTDEEVKMIVKEAAQYCPLYKIETVLDDAERGIRIRRQIIAERAKLPQERIDLLPYKHFDYSKVMNACCENVLGYVPIPVGYAGPLLLDGIKYYVPMATTEGALVASTNRGCKALSVRGVSSYVEDVGMTRAPCVKFGSVSRAAVAKRWLSEDQNYKLIKAEFDSTSRFGRLKECLVAMEGPQLYIRFVALTGDAMGMNMVSKGAEMALRCIQREFPDMQIISLSGNFCCDKKPAAINWIKGRGKRVVTECIIPAQTLRSVLKTDAKTLVECNKLKNMTGSAMAGSIGGK